MLSLSLSDIPPGGDNLLPVVIGVCVAVLLLLVIIAVVCIILYCVMGGKKKQQFRLDHKAEVRPGHC